MPKKDLNQLAKFIVGQATGSEPIPPELTARQENSRKGGIKGGAVRASKLSPEDRKDIATKAATSRWSKP